MKKAALYIRVSTDEQAKHGFSLGEQQHDLERYAAEQGWKVADDSREGVRVSFPKEQGDGWFLLRLSVHDPDMPLNVESDAVGGCDVILAQVEPFINKQTELRRK